MTSTVVVLYAAAFIAVSFSSIVDATPVFFRPSPDDLGEDGMLRQAETSFDTPTEEYAPSNSLLRVLAIPAVPEEFAPFVYSKRSFNFHAARGKRNAPAMSSDMDSMSRFQ